MLVIRFRRIGKKNQPTYRIVVAEHSYPIDGRFVADLGFYNPHTKATGLKNDEALEWMKKGARPSNSVAKLLERAKVKHPSVVVTKKNKASKQTVEESKPAAAPVAATEEAVAESEDQTVDTTESAVEAPEAAETVEEATEVTEEVAPEESPAESTEQT